MNQQAADLILQNGKIATQDDRRSVVEAAAIRDGKFLATGSDREVMRFRDERTKLINLNKRTVIPGLNDSHLHLIRGGLNYNLELRWDGVPSLADGLRMLREQARRTPPGQWVRVVREFVKLLKFGEVHLTVHKGRVVEIRKIEKVRFDDR